MRIAYDAVSIARRRVQVGTATLSYQVAGAGPPLVLLHGLAGSGRWWQRNIAHLAQRFRVYVLDLIGFGASRGSHPLIFDEVAGYMVAWMDQLGIRSASIVGHSMGGLIAADLAANAPDRIERLVLVDAAAFLIEQRYVYHFQGLLRELFQVQVDFFTMLVADAYRAGPFTLLNAINQLLNTDFSAKLSQVQAPTLLVWGEHDAIVPLEIGKRLCRHLPADNKLVVIKGAGHNPMWDRPGAFNRVVESFLLP
ncbi:MAG TPA: alpha/beta hydrolase [Roseiflexaceae bacterium]|nr:alpha/beta hydrolase [Roseiflexaceae bacterium]